MHAQERRRSGGDRRRQRRGGRRLEDRNGQAPLALVVTHEPSHLLFWEALLLNLKFAVVPCDGPGPALDALRALRPDVIVASTRDKAMLREQLPPGRPGEAVPLVELLTSPDFVEPVLPSILRALHVPHAAAS